MFAMFAALPLAFAATAFSLLFVCIEIGFFLAAIVLQFFIVRYKSRRAGLVLPLLAFGCNTLLLLGSLLAMVTSEAFDPLILLELLPSLIFSSLPAALLLLERRIILKRFCNTVPQATEAAR